MTTPQLSEVIEAAILEAQSQLFTMQLAVVYVLHPEDGTVDAQPVTSRVLTGKGYIDGAGTHCLAPHPNGLDTVMHQSPISRLAIAWPSGGGYSMTWPIAVGDVVLVIWSMLDHSDWENTGAVRSAPRAEHLHNRSHCYGVPLTIRSKTSPRPPTAVSPTEMVLGREDGSVQIVVGVDGVKLGGPEAVSPVAKGDVADANWTALKAWAAAAKTACAGGGIVLPDLGVSPYPINSEQAVKVKVV
jgi:hypothetical protein